MAKRSRWDGFWQMFRRGVRHEHVDIHVRALGVDDARARIEELTAATEHLAEVSRRANALTGADRRETFDAGYRWGYENGRADALAPEPHNADPGDAFDIWQDERRQAADGGDDDT